MRATGPGQSALLLLDVIDILHKREVPYAIIGALAASFYGAIRASVDADAVISVHSGQADAHALLAALAETGFDSVYNKGESGDPIGAVIAVKDRHQNRVDLLIRIRGLSEKIFSRSVEAEFMKSRIRFVGIEDFIAMKVLAGSPKVFGDAADVLRVARRTKRKIRLSLLRGLVQEQGKRASAKLEELLAGRLS